MKFRELVGFLGLSLTEVDNRWADGKGPLAVHMSMAELERLVMAVFEKTKRRDTFISDLHRVAATKK